LLCLCSFKFNEKEESVPIVNYSVYSWGTTKKFTVDVTTGTGFLPPLCLTFAIVSVFHTSKEAKCGLILQFVMPFQPSSHRRRCMA
jgi:hypothetical protein